MPKPQPEVTAKGPLETGAHKTDRPDQQGGGGGEIQYDKNRGMFHFHAA